MRLLYLEDGRLCITEDIRTEVPPYAILSHRYGEDEVTFADVCTGVGASKHGYAKVLFCGAQATKDGLRHFWIDNCCIDRNNREELSRSITSMYKWYAGASECYVYLSDVSYRWFEKPNWSDFRRSQWFTRGWTLQELLAPVRLAFYSHEGECLGTKLELMQTLSDITGIPTTALEGHPLHDFKEEDRFRWAIKRSTTEPEDLAYCLLGLFGVSLVPIYGEGVESAFDRLKEEIIRKHRNEIIKLDVKQLGDEHSREKQPARALVEQHDVGKPLQRSDTASTKDNTTSITRLERSTVPIGLSFAILPALDQASSVILHRRAQIRTALHAGMKVRASTVEHVSGVYQWVPELHMYRQWLNSNGNLWIVGGPGTGKSTCMKSLHQQLGQMAVTVGCYQDVYDSTLDARTIVRILLLRMLEAVPGLDQVFDYGRFGHAMTPEPEDFTNASLEFLQQVLLVMIEKLDRKVYLLLDLDLEPSQLIDLIVSMKHVSVVCSSHSFDRDTAMNDFPIILDQQSAYQAEMSSFIFTHLKDTAMANALDGVIKKRNGSWLWLRILLPMLQQGTITLDDATNNLHDILHHIFFSRRGLEPEDHMLCLQFVIFAARPLRLEEFYFTMISGMYGGSHLESAVQALDEGTMKQFLASYSRGLISVMYEATADSQAAQQQSYDRDRPRSRLHSVVESRQSGKFSTKRPAQVTKLRLLHSCVKDYVMNTGLSTFYKKQDSLYELAASHEQIRLCCELAIQRAVTLFSSPTDTIITSDGGSVQIYDLVSYAVVYLFYHADRVAPNISQGLFYDRCQAGDYGAWRELIRREPDRMHLQSNSLVATAAELGYVKLLVDVLKHDPTLANEKVDGQTALMIAGAADKEEAVQVLLNHGADPFSTDNSGKQALDYCQSQGTRTLLANAMHRSGRGFAFSEQEMSTLTVRLHNVRDEPQSAAALQHTRHDLPQVQKDKPKRATRVKLKMWYDRVKGLPPVEDEDNHTVSTN